ncbi:3878_t:CDS:2, partial [Ambispora leptoticha]
LKDREEFTKLRVYIKLKLKYDHSLISEHNKGKKASIQRSNGEKTIQDIILQDLTCPYTSKITGDFFVLSSNSIKKKPCFISELKPLGLFHPEVYFRILRGQLFIKLSEPENTLKDLIKVIKLESNNLK